jgi:hypothetical protein
MKKLITGRSEKIPFDTAGITLEEAIARVGGLAGQRGSHRGDSFTTRLGE